MRLTNEITDEAALKEVGARIAQYRLNKNLTQAELAKEAGISHSTINRIEYGNSSQFTNLIRVIRALDLLENMDALVPEPVMSPIQQLKLQGKKRQRASSKKTKNKKYQSWSWDTSL